MKDRVQEPHPYASSCTVWVIYTAQKRTPAQRRKRQAMSILAPSPNTNNIGNIMLQHLYNVHRTTKAADTR